MQWAGNTAVNKKKSNFPSIPCIFHSVGDYNLETNDYANEYLLQLR